jgi:hypothetical protein
LRFHANDARAGFGQLPQSRFGRFGGSLRFGAKDNQGAEGISHGRRQLRKQAIQTMPQKPWFVIAKTDSQLLAAATLGLK